MPLDKFLKRLKRPNMPLEKFLKGQQRLNMPLKNKLTIDKI
jgi:hypothetical protein